MAKTKIVKPKSVQSTTAVRTGRVLRPPANVLPPEQHHYLRTILLVIVGAIGVLIVIGLIVITYVLPNVFRSVGSYCNQKTQGATNQAAQQTNELKGVSLFGSKPQVSQSLDDDCVDGAGVGTATAAYQVGGMEFAQVNNGVIQALGGTESPFAVDPDSAESNAEIGGISTTVTAANGKTYDVHFLLSNIFNCPANVNNGVCDPGKDVVQTYALQNESIQEVDISIHNANPYQQ